MKKLLSSILVIAMLCSVFAGLTAFAYTEISILATDFSLTSGEYGDTSPNGFDNTWYMQKYFPVEVYSGNYGTFVEMLKSEWLTYRFNVETAGTYSLAMDAGTSAKTSITVKVNGTSYDTSLPSTSGVLNFTELTNLCSFYLNEGVNEIVIQNNGNYFNYRELILSSSVGSGTPADYPDKGEVLWWGNFWWEAGANSYAESFTSTDFTGDYYAKNPSNIGSSSFTMEPGDWGTYTFNAPYTGVYCMQLEAKELPEGTAVIRAICGDYYCEFFMQYPDWSNSVNNLQDQPMYFKEGNNTFIVKNVGDAKITVGSYDFGRLDKDGFDTLTHLPIVKKVADMPAEGATPTFCPTPTPTKAPANTPTPTVEPTPTPTAKPTATPTPTPTVEPTAVPTATPVATSAPTPTPTLPGGLTWVGNSSLQDGFSSYLGAVDGPGLLNAGQSATLTVNSAYSGVLGAQVRVDGLGGASTLRMAAGNYYCDIPFTGTETAWCDDELLDRPLYLQQGANTLTVTNLGPNYIDLAKIDFAYLNADGFDSLVYLPLVGQFDVTEPDTTPVPSPTPTPTVKPTAVPTATPVATSAPTPTPTLPGGLTWVGNSSLQDGFSSYLGAVDGPGLLNAGQSATLTVNSAYSGVLGAQVRVDGLGGASTLRMAAGNYYCDIPFTGTETAWCDDELLDRPLYLQQGANTLTVTNLGPNYINLGKIDFAYLNADGFDSLVYLPLVGKFDVTEPDPTLVPSPTPDSVNPDVSDRAMRTVYEGENYKSGSLSKTTYNGASVATATSESTVTYSVTVEEDTIYNLYMKGAAWKDVSFDIALDGTVYYYETAHFQSDRNATFSYNEECVATFPLSKGTHTIGFTFYCDTYYFDSFTLEDTYSKEYQILYGIKDISTSQGIYEALLSAGDYIYVDVAADTADLACPEMAFWGMVGKDYSTPAELKALYESVLADELENPTVKIKNVSNVSVSDLPAGKSTVTVNCADIPTNTSLVCAIYKGGKLIQIPQVQLSNSTSVSFSLTDVEAGCELKILALTDMEDLKPYTSSGTYMDYYVATNGKSTNAGTSPDAPLATVAQALTKVKSVNSAMTGDIIIHVAPGVYRSNVTINIDPTMSGMNGYKVIIQGDDPDNRPIFSGGEPLTGKWSQVSGKNYWVATTTTRETRALYVNGYQAVLARSSDIYAGSYITPSSPKNDDHIADGLKVSLSSYPNFPKDLAGETRLQMVYNLAWANQRFPIDSVTYDSSYAYVNATYPYYNALLLSGHTSTVQPTEGRGFYLENAMALLDRPGEFYFDKANRKMYYYPYANEDMTTAETYCAVTDGLLNIQGANISNRVENLEFKNVSFRHGAWDEATTYGAAYNQADELRRGTETGYSQHLMHAQIVASYADSLVFDGCEFAELGSSAMYLVEGVTNSKVINCDFRDISGGGVSVSNYLHNSNYGGGVRCKNIEIGNNIFRRVAQEFMNLPAVAVYYVDSANVHHNDIKYLPYTGISIGWGWGYYEPNDTGNHIVSYNKIEEVCQVLDDGAQIYTLGDQKNMHLNDNYLIDPGNYRRGGVYFDEATGYISMTDNVIQQANQSGDFWLFARRRVNLNDNYVAYNHTDGGNPKSFATFPLDTSGVTYATNYINQTSWKTTAQRIMAEAGVEDKTRVADVSYYPSWRTLPMFNLPADAIID